MFCEYRNRELKVQNKTLIESKSDVSKPTSIVSSFQMGMRRTRQEIEHKIKLAFLAIKIFLKCFGDSLQHCEEVEQLITVLAKKEPLIVLRLTLIYNLSFDLDSGKLSSSSKLG